MQNLIITTPAIVVLIAGFFSLGGVDPAAQTAALSSIQAPAAVVASAAPASSGPALFRVRGEWVAGEGPSC